ncbi:unnamed protein product [Clavelina lepadiformis]|uniref:Insulin-like domain-containing protein n=1 Tax=Clavelina lepadiformis TaxID=159417 RepID=A0ABP0G0V4_CLALP
MKLAILLFLLYVTCQAQEFQECGYKLIEVQRHVCQDRSSTRMLIEVLKRRYGSRRRFSLRHRRSSLNAEWDKVFSAFFSSKTFTERVESSSEGGVLRPILKAATELNNERVYKRRLRRGIVGDCCHRRCTRKHIQQTYCPR